jgi:hypothetical protein
MRRNVSIVVGACAALVLAGTSGAVAWAQTGSKPGAVWHDPPAAGKAAPALSPASAKVGDRAAVPRSMAGSPAPPQAAADPEVLPESATAAAKAGRQKVGELVTVDKLLGYGQPRESFTYPGASFVKLHFDRLAMLPGDYLTVANSSGTESYRYDAPAVLSTGTVSEWAMSVTGDTAMVEMHHAGGGVPESTGLPGGLGVNVDHVARGFSSPEQAREPTEQLAVPGRTGREESVCGGDQSVDAVCYQSADPVAYMRSKAVARLLINGTELCTSWRVGAKDRMITNNHCFATSADAANTEVWFNYQCTACGGHDTFQPTKVRGDKVLATDHAYDYTLFTVANFASIQKFGYLLLDTARPRKGQELYVPQHPAGEPTRIAGALGKKASTCAVTDNAYDGYATNSDVAYLCDTEGGSSGSPVLSRATNKVVALHHFGGCPNSGVRGDVLAAKLARYL